MFALVVAGLIVAWPWFAPLIDGADVGGSDMGRLSIWRETLYLIGQAPITGWGPRAFEGAFSLYARLIRVPLFEYAHHLYLGLAFEQGIGGLAVWLALQIVALGALLRADVRAGGSDPFRLAGLVSLLTLAVHGLLDDPVYAGGAVPLLFAGVGFAGLFGRSQPVAELTRRALTIALGALALVARRRRAWRATCLQAAWHVDQAALSLNAQELAHWPTIDAVTDPAPAEAELETALQLDPEQVAARFRRGLLALNARDCAAAEADLACVSASAAQPRSPEGARLCAAVVGRPGGRGRSAGSAARGPCRAPGVSNVLGQPGRKCLEPTGRAAGRPPGAVTGVFAEIRRKTGLWGAQMAPGYLGDNRGRMLS